MKLKDPPADMEVPQEIEIRLSNIDTEKMGLWCRKAIKKGSRFGPFVGEKALEVDDRMDPTYIWEIVDVETKEFLFYINATDPRRCNWMRYINCARYFEEQNILSEQDGIDIFYQAIKDIAPGEELLTWYEKTPLRKRKGKRRSVSHVRRAKTSPEPSSTTTSSKVSTSETSSTTSVPATAGGASVSQRGRRRSAKKYWQIEETADPREAAEAAGEVYGSNDDEMPAVVDDSLSSDVNRSTELSHVDRPPDDATTGRYFQFELLPVHTGTRNRLGRKMFECDVCSGVYRHGFSLKRHYLRNHINRRYISRVDALNCNLTYCGDDDDVNDDDDDQVTSAAGRRQALRRKKAAESAAMETESSVDVTLTGGQATTMHASPDSGTSRHSDDGATLHMDVEEIDPPPPPLADPTSPPSAVNDLPALYRCYVCERHFDTVPLLKAHVCDSKVIGDSGKRFACRHCQMQFRHRQNLVRHELVHTGVKPYTCDKCNKCFPTLTNRRRHERIHGGCRLACWLCASSFTQTGDLKKHVRRQHPESYRACAYCPRYFTADSQLSVHLRRAHPGSDLDANRRQVGDRRDARCAALEADRAESRRLGASVTTTTASSGDQFACTICCKYFTDYANMCRHRRLAHGCGVRGVDPDASSSEGDDSQTTAAAGATSTSTSTTSVDAQQAYFSNVSCNIAANLNNHVEGKAEHLSRAGSHIRWRQGTTAHASSSTAETPAGQIRLEEFNFPRGFQIRASSELCAVTPPSSRDKHEFSRPVKSGKDAPAKHGGGGGGSVEPERLKDPVLISVPDVRQCSVCRTVFHSSAQLEQHMAHHQHTDELTVATAETSLDKPLDLSAVKTDDGSFELVADVPHLLVEMAEPQSAERTASMCRKYVCLVCFREYSDSEELLLHQAERHPNIDCRHIEVDQDFQSIDVGMRPRTVGVLNVSSSQLPALPDDAANAASASIGGVTCTKCRQNFASRAALHAHIVECGDYWRSLADRLTWVFVLRGSELPAQQSTSGTTARKQQGRRCGKFRWGSSASHESVRRQMQRMLIKQHVGGSTSEARRASARISSQRPGDSPPLMDSPTGGSTPRDSPRKPLPPPPPHSLRRHVRRRAAANCSTTAGDVSTINYDETTSSEPCTDDATSSAPQGDEQPVVETKENKNDDDDDIDPTKHMCIYCSRQFTLLRALRRHVVDGCTMRRDLVQQEEYLDEEWEAQLNASVPGGGRSSGEGAGEDAPGEDGVRRSGGKRRRRCRHWGSSKSKSRRSARSSGDDADDSLFGWEDAFLSTWGKHERADITVQPPRRDDTQVAPATQQDTTTDVKSATALAQLLTSDIVINVSDRETRTSSDDLDTLVQRSSTCASSPTCLPAASSVAVTTTSTSGASFAVKLELLTGSPQFDSADSDKPISSSQQQVADVVVVVDEALKTDAYDDDDADISGAAALNSSGTSSSVVSDTPAPIVDLPSAFAGDSEVKDEAANDDSDTHRVADDVSSSHVPDDDEGVATGAAHGGNTEESASGSSKGARRRRAPRLTMAKRKKS